MYKAWAIAGLFLAAGFPLTAPAQDAVFGHPDKQFQVSGRLKIPEKTLYLPVTQVKWMIHGKFTARGGAFRGAASSKEVTSDVDEARVRRVAQVLHDDLVVQLQGAGWRVHTRHELGDDVPRYKAAAPNSETGYPIEDVASGALKMSYGVFAPEGMPTLMLSTLTGTAGGGGLQGLGALANMAATTGITQESYRYAREKPGVTMIVDYGFATAALGETKSRMLGTEASAALVMTGGWLAYTANSQSVVKLKEGIEVAEGIGTLDQISRTGTGTNVLRYLSGMSTIDKTGYMLTPDWDKVEAEAIRAGKAFNAQIVAKLGG